MAKFKITIVVEADAIDMEEAQCLAFDFVTRGNDSYDGDVGEVVKREVEEIA